MEEDQKTLTTKEIIKNFLTKKENILMLAIAGALLISLVVCLVLLVKKPKDEGQQDTSSQEMSEQAAPEQGTPEQGGSQQGGSQQGGSQQGGSQQGGSTNPPSGGENEDGE